MPAPIPHFIPLEVRRIDPPRLIRLLANLRRWALIPVRRMEMVIHVAPEIGRTVGPWARPNEYAAHKPFRTVIPRRRTGVGRDVVVTIRTVGGYSDCDIHLSRCLRSGSRQAHRGNRG